MNARFSGLISLALCLGCGGKTATPAAGGTGDGASTGDGALSADGGTCQLTAGTTATSTVTEDCPLLARDTTSCEGARSAAGLTGYWLKFSCRVVITKDTTGTQEVVQLTADSLPDYASNYFSVGDPCRSEYVPAARNPNTIRARNLTMRVPLQPTAGGALMGSGAVGLALNGVEIYDNQAAPGDDIYLEAQTFDLCEGHPTGGSVYHYHSEPHSISVDDSRFIGVMLDGYPVYGRRDLDGSVPTLDAAGGHTDPTVDSATPVYHYHVNEQRSITAGTAGQSAWFITTGRYAGVPGTCTGC